MKNLVQTFTASFFYCFFAQSYAQTDIYKAQLYELKSSKQKKTAVTLAASGAAAIATGFLIAEIPSSGNGFFTKTEQAGYSIASLGGIAIITAVPFAILSVTNKNRHNKLQPTLGRINMTVGEPAIVTGIKYTF